MSINSNKVINAENDLLAKLSDKKFHAFSRHTIKCKKFKRLKIRQYIKL
jgi:hypothetical protein